MLLPRGLWASGPAASHPPRSSPPRISCPASIEISVHWDHPAHDEALVTFGPGNRTAIILEHCLEIPKSSGRRSLLQGCGLLLDEPATPLLSRQLLYLERLSNSFCSTFGPSV